MLSTGLLPEPALVGALCRLASHDDPDVCAQAVELCATLPPPIRLRAAEQLAAQGAAAGAARCIWPDDLAAQARFLRAAAYALVADLRPLWLVAHPDDLHLDRFLSAVAERDRTGAVPPALQRRAQQLARLSAHTTSRAARRASQAALALMDPSPASAVRSVVRHVQLQAGEPSAAGRQLAAFLRRTLRGLPLIDAPLRVALAQAFAAALDEGDTDRARLLLGPGCAYHNRGQVITGPQEIIDSYARSAASARARFPSARSESRVVSEADLRVTIESREHLGGHTFTCRQHLLFDPSGSIWRIEHEDLPGEIAALEAFLRRSG